MVIRDSEPAGRHGFARALKILVTLLLVLGCLAGPAAPATSAANLLSADFGSGDDGFIYQDDAFGTSQPDYASGSWQAASGYSGGGLEVALGGVDDDAITGMSGGWRYTLNLETAETGVVLSLRYKLDQTATYEYDEYTRMLVQVDGAQYGRGAKNYVDHIGGDGSSSQGNSSSYLPTTDWQQHEVYVGDLAAGPHTIVLGGYNNKKDAADESTTVLIDDVLLTSDNVAPVPSAAETLAGRVDINQFLAFNQGVAQFDDRCRGSSVQPCSSTDYTTNYMNALAWVETQLQGMGYATFRHDFTYGSGGANLCGTKLGTVTPTEMYIVSGHLDGRGSGDAFDDDGSGTALVLEAARVLAGADVTTDKSVRFCFWDKEELGFYGASGYVQDRQSLQGTTDEPTWLGVIQHDMILYDHGAGTRTTEQNAYADLDVEWRAGTAQEADSRALALKWAYAGGQYAPDYPATAYNYSVSTDDTVFHSSVASISVRENRRSLTSGDNAEWINPNYHTVNDIEDSYTRDDDGDGKRDDIELGYNAVRTTLGLVAELAGAHFVAPNTAPTADPQSVSTACNTPVSITLSGLDAENDPLIFSVDSLPAHGALSGAAPNLLYAPATDYSGADSFTFVANDGSLNSAPATINITVGACSVVSLPFVDDFESDRGWTVNPTGTDSATGGRWERTDPQPADHQGPKQLGDTPSGRYDLVTGALAGNNASRNDLDGGVTSIRSPGIQLPTGQDITLSLEYYFAYARNASPADYFRVQVIGATTVTVLEARGANRDVDAAWRSFSASLNSFAGQTVYVLIEASDGAKDSLVEAAVDDVSVTAAAPSPPILSATFDGDSQGFAYADDSFRSTGQPDYTSGAWVASGGHDGGALQVTLGGIDTEIVEGLSNGWARDFTVATAGPVNVSFWFKLTQSPHYEDRELSQVLVSIDGVLYGSGTNDCVAQIAGNGNGGIAETTGWQIFSADLDALSEGPHTLMFGGHNNRKSYTNETTEVLLDDVVVTAR